jgi:threonine synthase
MGVLRGTGSACVTASFNVTPFSIVPGFLLGNGGDPSTWRYELLFTLQDEDSRMSLHINYTLFHRAENLAAQFGVRELYVKDHGENPCWYSKDREARR